MKVRILFDWVFKHWTLCLTLITITCFFMSYLYYAAYLRAFGSSIEELPKSYSDYLLLLPDVLPNVVLQVTPVRSEAFLAYLVVGASIGVLFFSLIPPKSLLLSTASTINAPTRAAKFLKRFWYKLYRPVKGALIGAFVGTYSPIAFSIVMLAPLLPFALLAESAATVSAKKLIDGRCASDATKPQTGEVPCKLWRKDNEEHTGVVVATNGESLLLFNPDTKEAVILPARGHSFVVSTRRRPGEVRF